MAIHCDVLFDGGFIEDKKTVSQIYVIKYKNIA